MNTYGDTTHLDVNNGYARRICIPGIDCTPDIGIDTIYKYCNASSIDKSGEMYDVNGSGVCSIIKRGIQYERSDSLLFA